MAVVDPKQKALDEFKRNTGEDGVFCSCNNIIALSKIYCPYCKKFNASTTAKNCPTCGQVLTKA